MGGQDLAALASGLSGRLRGGWLCLAAWLTYWVRFFRPEFWIVAVFPAWVGWALATRQIVPEQLLVIQLLARLGEADWSAGAALAEVAVRHWRVMLALVTLGPFLGGAIMVTNDYYDRQVDVFNPKKATSPLAQGTATPERARFWMMTLTTATIVSGFVLDLRFGVLLGVGLVLSFLYSAPPVRLKSRPLGDVAVNAVGYGGVTTIAGWGLGGGWYEPLPLGALFIVVLAIAAAYLPTVMMDRETDARSGLRTTAVALGLRASWILGFEALLLANAAMIGLALSARYVQPTFILLQAPFFAVELLAYVFLVSREKPSDLLLGAAFVAAGFFGNLLAFLLVYTGAT